MNLSRTRGKRKDIREVWAEREKAREERGRPGMFRGTNYVSGAQLDAEDAQKRELAKQALVNKGQLDVTDRSQIGETKRAGMREAGLAEQADKTRDMSMRRLGFDQEKEQTRFTESARDYGLEKKRMQLDKMFKDRKFTSDQKKSYLERLDKLTAPRLDPEGYPIEDTGMPYGKALEQMDFEERALKERRG